MRLWAPRLSPDLPGESSQGKGHSGSESREMGLTVSPPPCPRPRLPSWGLKHSLRAVCLRRNEHGLGRPCAKRAPRARLPHGGERVSSTNRGPACQGGETFGAGGWCCPPWASSKAMARPLGPCEMETWGGGRPASSGDLGEDAQHGLSFSGRGLDCEDARVTLVKGKLPSCPLMDINTRAQTHQLLCVWETHSRSLY